ncbi:DUF1249 domain-containing protein [Suttonella sp. R2A3]|uniref:DUF1249 domain-containing protein n=1 Tax=Suttonella sp. R2A3 TaxID=2908648 RepID=UPI001F3C4DCA|nr:DUF1249 domain-containing protein [Suttonella sp. R2A3]UJF24356.1 DUF1249 domain-containing protein [Suttonella sp. R2A3]
MQHPRFMHDNASLQALYEQNYTLFRLLLPRTPKTECWHVLEAPERREVYVRCTAQHAYTSEWLLAHHFPERGEHSLAPDHCIRVYHDARLVEARIETLLAVNACKAVKLRHNRALAEWLDYCRRHGYKLNESRAFYDLPNHKVHQ